MPQVVYAMQFTGKGSAVEGAQNVIKAATTAPSCMITSEVGPQGLRGSVEPIAGGKASFESTVTFTGESTFQESGTISFGTDRHRLRFSTVGEGHVAPSAEQGLMHGCVIWRVDGGEGQFEGATGLITSNFTFTMAGDVVDNHFGVLFIK
jgi:hypothetical protein